MTRARALRALLFANLASILVFFRGGRKAFVEFIVGVKNLYIQQQMIHNGINEIRLGDIATKDYHSIYLPMEYTKPGSTPWYDLLVLGTLARRYNPEVVFEIGTFEGLGSLVICNNSTPNTLFTLDLPHNEMNSQTELSEFAIEDHSIDARYEPGKLLPFIKSNTTVNQLIGDSWTFDYSSYHEVVDFFFIDGAHTRRYVLRDTLNALRCVREGGVIAWHDVRNSQVIEPISRLTPYYPIFYVGNSNLCFATIEVKDQASLDLITDELARLER